MSENKSVIIKVTCGELQFGRREYSLHVAPPTGTVSIV